MSEKCPVCNNEIVDSSASVCPNCGFKLLGATEKFDPVRTGGEGREGERTGELKAELRVVRGPSTGVVIELKPGVLTLGRDPQCDIFLNDMTVSRKHAELTFNEDGCVITDTNSYNGVWVNDKAIESCLLRTGDLVQLGAFCLAYRERIVNRA